MTNDGILGSRLPEGSIVGEAASFVYCFVEVRESRETKCAQDQGVTQQKPMLFYVCSPPLIICSINFPLTVKSILGIVGNAVLFSSKIVECGGY